MTASRNYLTPLNRASIRPPYFGTNALLQGGWLEGDRPALQALLDRTINRVAPETHRFISPLSSALYTALFIEDMRSEHPLDRAFGGIPEGDVSFWILTFGGLLGREADWRLRWMPTYMFVDDFGAVIGGRERYGFPKVHGFLHRNSDRDDDFGLKVEARAMKKKGASQKLEYMEIFSVSGAAANTDPDGERDYSRLVSKWRDNVLDGAIGSITGLVGRLGLPQASFPVVNAMQAADPANPNLAAFQKLYETPMNSTRIHDAGWVGDLDISFTEPQTAAIAAEHGAKPNTRLTNCLWVRHDFRTEIAIGLEAPTSERIGTV